MKKINKLVRAMNKSYDDYLSKKGNLEAELFETVDFEYSIDHMQGDGFLILDADEASVAGLQLVLKRYDQGKIYTRDDHDGVSI